MAATVVNKSKWLEIVPEDKRKQFTEASTDIFLSLDGLLNLKEKLQRNSPLLPSVNMDQKEDKDMTIYGIGITCDMEFEVVLKLIAETMNLIIVLELERLETLELSSLEEKAATSLLGLLNKEEQLTLTLLPQVVQEEHEKANKEITELKGSISYNQRHLYKAKSRFSDVAQRNKVLSERCVHLKNGIPAMEERAAKAEEEIGDIKKQQKEMTRQLNLAEEALREKEATYSATQRQVNLSLKQIEETKKELYRARDDTEKWLQRQEADLSKTEKCILSTKSSIQEQLKQLDLLKKRVKAAEIRVATCEKEKVATQEKKTKLEEEFQEAKEHHQTIAEDTKHQKLKLEGDLAAERGQLKSCSRRLRDLLQFNQELHHEGSELREQIASVIAQTKETIRDIQRISEEMKKVDMQLEVSNEVYTTTTNRHGVLKEKASEEETRVMETELNLKANLEALEFQMKDEAKIKTIYESKLQVDGEDLDKVINSCKTKIHKAAKSYGDWEEKVEVQTVKTNMTTEEHDKWMELVRGKENQLHNLREVERKYNEDSEHFKKEMLPQLGDAKQLCFQKQLQIQKLEKEIPEMEASIEHFKKVTVALNDRLLSLEECISTLKEKLKEMEHKIQVAREEERNLSALFRQRKEFQSACADSYSSYISKKQSEIHQMKEALVNYMSANQDLAKEYKYLQEDQLKWKSLALRELDKRVDMEVSIRDQKQLMLSEGELTLATSDYHTTWMNWARSVMESYVNSTRSSRKRVFDIKRTMEAKVHSVEQFIYKELYDNSLLYPVANN